MGRVFGQLMTQTKPNRQPKTGLLVGYPDMFLTLIPANNQSTLVWHAANCRTVGITCNLQLYAAGYLLTRTCKLTVIHSIVTSSFLYIPQDFPLFVIILLTFSTTASHGSWNTAARCDWSRSEPNNGWFIECAPGWDTAATLTPVSPPRRCNCS